MNKNKYEIIVLGDLHFASDKPWQLEVGENIISWHKNSDFNNENNYLILSGDITDKHLLDGKVIEQVYRFFDSMRYKKIYIVVGNHDLKYKGGIESYPYEYLNHYKNIKILSEPAEIFEIEDFKFLSLPFYSYKSNLPPHEIYYSSLSNIDVDVIVGHIADKSIYPFGSVDLENINHTWKSLGHIHSPLNSNYMGSLYPLSIGEKQENRFYHSYSVNEIGKMKEIKELPTFLKFEDIYYPQKIIKQDYIQVFSIYNYPKELKRKDYQNIYIRKIVSETLQELSEEFSSDENHNFIKNPKLLIDEYLKEHKEIEPHIRDMVQKYFV